MINLNINSRSKIDIKVKCKELFPMHILTIEFITMPYYWYKQHDQSVILHKYHHNLMTDILELIIFYLRGVISKYNYCTNPDIHVKNQCLVRF